MPLRLPKYAVPVSVIGTCIGGVVLLKEYAGGGKYKGKERIPGRTVIVTGANTGIGRETALELAKRGGRIILACRDMEKAEKACQEIQLDSYNKNVVAKKLDLASLKSVREFAEDINQSENRLDLLINNAGVMRCPKMLTEDGFEMQLGVNHLGHFLLTNLLLEKLEKSGTESRIVNLSSLAHTRGSMNFEDLNSAKNYDPGAAYNQSKLANILFTRQLAKNLKGKNITTYAVHPGVVKTELARHMSISKSYISSAILGPLFWLVMKTPRQGAQTTLYCALSENVSRESGKYYSDCAEKEPSEKAQNDADAERLWAISEKWTRLT